MSRYLQPNQYANMTDYQDNQLAKDKRNIGDLWKQFRAMLRHNEEMRTKNKSVGLNYNSRSHQNIIDKENLER